MQIYRVDATGIGYVEALVMAHSEKRALVAYSDGLEMLQKLLEALGTVVSVDTTLKFGKLA